MRKMHKSAFPTLYKCRCNLQTSKHEKSKSHSCIDFQCFNKQYDSYKKERLWQIILKESRLKNKDCQKISLHSFRVVLKPIMVFSWSCMCSKCTILCDANSTKLWNIGVYNGWGQVSPLKQSSIFLFLPLFFVASEGVSFIL